MTGDMRQRFRELHEDGIFVMPNPWDVGSARLLEAAGFPALATTSSGHAATLGRLDGSVTREELVEHAAAIVAAVGVPLNVDAEHCFADSVEGVAETVRLLAGTGAAGMSIEDWNPEAEAIDPFDRAVERVAAAAAAAAESGIVLTARAENHVHGVDDLDDTIRRLQAYREAGADVVYAPGLVDIAVITRVVETVDAPVNVLARPTGPAVPELGKAGVRRVSTGGALAWAAYGAALRGADELLTSGTSNYSSNAISRSHLARAFAPK